MMPNCTVSMPLAAASGTNIGVSSSSTAAGSRQVDEHADSQHDEVHRKNDHPLLTERVLNEGYECRGQLFECQDPADHAGGQS